MGSLLFWVGKTDPNIDTADWDNFRTVLVVFLIVSIIVGVALALSSYRKAVRSFKIRSSDDVFRPFSPGRKLWLALLAGVVMAVLAIGFYLWQFSGSYEGSFIAPGLVLGLVAALLAILVAFPVARSGMFTPRMFRYRKLVRS